MQGTTADHLGVGIRDGAIQGGRLAPNLKGVEERARVDNLVAVEVQLDTLGRDHVEVVHQVGRVGLAVVFAEELEGAAVDHEGSAEGFADEGAG